MSSAVDAGNERLPGTLAAGQSQSAAESCVDIPRLLQSFEGLGDNCDFGVLQQRAVGIEQFGLFRFATCKPEDVAALLRVRFDYLGEPDDLWLDPVEPRREFWVKSRRCSFEAHTDRFAGRDDAETIRQAQIEKIRYLKTRLIRDLSRGRRLCVWRGAADRAVMQDMAAQLRTYAPANCLLWVTVDAQRAGAVERVSDELLLGFLSRYGDYDGGPRLPVAEWLTVCAKAYRLWRNAEPPRAALDNLLARAAASGACRWFGDKSVMSRKIDAQGPTDRAVFEHRLDCEIDRAAICGALLPISAGGSFVFSAWVRIAEGFRGRQVSAVLGGFDSIADWGADPLALGWQRIWVSANLPPEAREISCIISAAGAAGDIVQSASWCLERGNRPTGYGFVL